MTATKLYLPLYAGYISAGLPNVIEDSIAYHLDLNTYLIKQPEATFFMRASGNSWQKAGIFSGDLLVVDRSIQIKSGYLVIATANEELTVKQLVNQNDCFYLLSANSNYYPPIKIIDPLDLVIWGVVTYVIHACR